MHLVEEVRLTRNKLYTARFTTSNCIRKPNSSNSRPYSIFFFHSTFERIPWAMTLLILTPIPISAIYPSSMDPQSFDQWYEITIYPKLSSVYPFFSNATNLLYINNSYSFSCIKRNSENILSLINKGTSMIHIDFDEILHDFSLIWFYYDNSYLFFIK